MSELLDAFAANLSKLCQAEGGTARVSQAMKMPRQQLNRYLAGGTQPTDRNVERICNFFGVTPPRSVSETR